MSKQDIEQETEKIQSRSQLKREMLALQNLGERLVKLSSDQLKRMNLPEELQEAVFFAQTLKKHGAKGRQMQRIGAIMRRVDPEPIQNALVDIDKKKYDDIKKLKQIETWRDELIKGDNSLLENIINDFGAERQKLRQLVRNAQKEIENKKPPKAYKNLFRYLKEMQNV